SRLSAGDGEIVRRNPLGRRGRVAGHAVVTSSPGLASMRQARSTGPPLTLIRQSKQTPMPQNRPRRRPPKRVVRQARTPAACRAAPMVWPGRTGTGRPSRSEEHTSELQSRENLVCRLLLEKRKGETYG